MCYLVPAEERPSNRLGRKLSCLAVGKSRLLLPGLMRYLVPAEERRSNRSARDPIRLAVGKSRLLLPGLMRYLVPPKSVGQIGHSEIQLALQSVNIASCCQGYCV